ncbi:hypothetical protein BOSEA31B_12364 [Hyphomicrobiales bacterium]|nr:hypothetical protein BOSEA31B_12364 [Hyphomicrobiales bacterium]CAH1698143.1 hypothetical protein BOSEA1005_11188 [Hyphomicrobiales bacterium]CAI0347786.1 hypothetical protein BO1005MUT1_90147 [Hyphomicrobiales bacterium]
MKAARRLQSSKLYEMHPGTYPRPHTKKVRPSIEAKSAQSLQGMVERSVFGLAIPRRMN